MPARRTTPQGYDTAKKLRKELTPAERKLWALIRNDQLGVNFRRQHAIGKYIPDFVCIKKKLIVELDGSQHLDQADYDAERTKHLESQGYKVIRFWNNEVMNDINGVIRAIQFALEDTSAGSHPGGEGEESVGGYKSAGRRDQDCGRQVTPTRPPPNATVLLSHLGEVPKAEGVAFALCRLPKF